ncbi:low molecular weight phosphatase family protein [Dokdonia sp. Asnod1-B02]|uniref:arsenate-mycothiol transferase ArsC n=1 Tax=Dokdonia sp. Asnod1-B02 TaxID=3160573 RepID=UPI003865D7E5
MAINRTALFPEIVTTIERLSTASISEERKAVLQPLADYIQSKASNKEAIRLNFICTHNSRRSHLSQVWAQAMASYFHITNVSCYSGGTEATALFPMAAQTLVGAGFQIAVISPSENPVYSIKYGSNEQPVIGFSKTMDHAFNPSSKFGAIMTCSQADEGCPFVPGAEKRFPITYDDPKAFDNTPQQAQKYQERSLQIATELLFVFAQIKA